MSLKVRLIVSEECAAPLLAGFVRIKQDEITNDLVWFGVLSQQFTSGALVDGVMEKLEDWDGIKDDFAIGNFMLWLATQPAGKALKIVTHCRCGGKGIHKAVHQLKD